MRMRAHLRAEGRAAVEGLSDARAAARSRQMNTAIDAVAVAAVAEEALGIAETGAAAVDTAGREL